MEAHLDAIGYLGEAIGRVDGQVLFVAYGLPGEDVVVEVSEVRRRFVRARMVEVRNPSPARAAAPCPVFTRCGGCQLQHVDYPTELTFKQSVVEQQLRRIGGFPEPPLRPIIGAAHAWNYRNHVRFQPDRAGRLCFTRPQSHDLVAIPTCWLVLEPIDEALRTIHGFAHGLHQVAIRYGARREQLLVSPHIPSLDGVLPTGQESYEEVLLGRPFRVSATSFFQVNTRPAQREVPETLRAPWLGERLGSYSQADLLALAVLDKLEASGDEVLVDAYCGVGTFTLLAADRVRRVVGIEESGSAIADAAVNSRGVANARFIRGKTEEVLPELEERIDVAILDPSRLGCDSAVMTALIKVRPRQIIYVSCDPATLARDLGVLSEWAYDLVEVQPVDMFPRTFHVENVAVLRLREPT
ncbi:MAG: class I SAM-dependent RNA methyltransferase [Chloroflexi bacterium]|nr:class I SAM-dependent RNA methyltransferase [Chloroflexota bacterium]